MKILRVRERIDWFKDNEPKNWKSPTGEPWSEFIENDLCTGSFSLYSYAFNNPYYCGPTPYTDDEARHILLDDFDIPRKL